MGHRFCYFSIVIFQAYGCFEEIVPVSRRLCLELLFLDTCKDKQVLTMIVRMKLLYKSYLACSDINERYGIG